MTRENHNVADQTAIWNEIACRRQRAIARTWVGEGSHLSGYRAGSGSMHHINLPPIGIPQISDKYNTETLDYPPCWIGPYPLPSRSDDLPDCSWSLLMKATITAAVTALSLFVGTAYAQGLPPNMWSSESGLNSSLSQPRHNETVFLGRGTVFAKIFGHAENNRAGADHIAEQNAAPARNG